MTNIDKVSRFIGRHSMLKGATGILVAVSGGPDSVALLDMLLRLAAGAGGGGLGAGEKRRSSTNPQPPIPITHIHVAHLDHMLRGAESAGDAQFVRALAERLGLRATITSADVRAAAKLSGRGIEEVAREIRYRFLQDVADQTGCDRIALGHTMTDQAETFLMRLIRGAGLRGLSAMRPLSLAPVPELGRTASPPRPLLIRPLLCITREEVEAHCCERGLEFRTDDSNQNLDYTRNRVRHEILPALKEINPRVVEAIARATETIAGDQDALDQLAATLLERARFSSRLGKGTPYAVAALMEQTPAVRRRMIIEALRSATAPNSGDDSSEISSTHVAAVESLLEPNTSGKRIILPGRLEAWREFDALVVKRRTVAHDAGYEFSINSAHTVAEAGGFSFALERGLDRELLSSIIGETKRVKQQSGVDWMIVALDDDLLPDSLIIRARRPGESAHVAEGRTRKLKNLMIDHRIPASRRAEWPVVSTLDGGYVWSPGLPPDREIVACEGTERLAVLRASELSN